MCTQVYTRVFSGLSPIAPKRPRFLRFSALNLEDAINNPAYQTNGTCLINNPTTFNVLALRKKSSGNCSSVSRTQSRGTRVFSTLRAIVMNEPPTVPCALPLYIIRIISGTLPQSPSSPRPKRPPSTPLPLPSTPSA